MTGLVYVDVALGLIFVILVYSLLASAVQEVIAGLLSWRSHALKAGMARLLGKHFDTVWNSPLIDSLRGPVMGFGADESDRPAKGRDPSHIEPEIFAQAVLERLGLAGKTPAEIVAEIREMESEGTAAAVHQRLAAVLSGVEGGIGRAEAAVARWYDAAMGQVSGWYVRRVKFTLFFIGLALAAATNMNLFTLAQRLIEDEALRATLVSNAAAVAGLDSVDAVRIRLRLDPAEPPKAEDVERLRAKLLEEIEAKRAALDAAGIPVGWQLCDGGGEPAAETSSHCGFTSPADVLASLLSWLGLAALVTLGAQFWFDLLKRFVAVRTAGVKLLAPQSKA